MEHEVALRNNGPTILTGPNGAGKTHVLRLLQYSLGLELQNLMRVSFGELTLRFSDGQELNIVREADHILETVTLRIDVDHLGLKRGDTAVVTSADIPEVEELPPFIVRQSQGLWIDSRTDTTLTRSQVERRYGIQLPPSGEEILKDHANILAIASNFRPMMIDTKRLDRSDPLAVRRSEAGRRSTERINDYIDAIRRAITEARRESIQATQSADLSFAARALAVAKLTVRESSLRQRYNEVVAQYERLASNGMAIGERPLPYPDETSPTVRRILKVFLDDWENRLRPLLPVNEKIQALRDVLDSKLAQSQKVTAMGRPQGRLTFRTFDNRVVSVRSLSSGEQHLVALFTLLLFSATKGSVVLIDEPEISMHAAWKHAFIEDINRVAEVTDLQVIIATHSTAIINGRWDLTEELSFSGTPVDLMVGDDESADESDEFVVE